MVAANLGDDSPWGDAIADTVTGSGVVGAAGTWEDVNAETLDGEHHDANTELGAGAIFKFDINVDKGVDSTAGGGACEDLSGVGQTLLLKLVVDDGGTTVTELSIDSLTAGASVV